MKAYQRFINYVKVHTTSSDETTTFPSTETQIPFALELSKELNDLGITSEVDKYGYVYAEIPPTKGYENATPIGFIAHVDTSPAFSGEGVVPLLHEKYNGEDIILPKNNCVISPKQFPCLKNMVGKTIITADGSTLLGADDKAGVAEIITACEEVLYNNLPHGPLKIAFTPDEEVGNGAKYFNVERFGAKYAYTLDGDLIGGIDFENFNAASARVEITGVAVHPGSAKNIMENAILIAMEISNLLPSNQTPGTTENYEGFFHIEAISGHASGASMDIIIRDHDEMLFKQKKELMESVCLAVQKNHPTASIKLTVEDSYYNMRKMIEPCMHLIENAKLAVEQTGVVPVTKAIRGGTDGARLSYMGLPCPNLGTGGTNFHGPYELIPAEDMDTAVEMIKNIIAIYAKQ